MAELVLALGADADGRSAEPYQLPAQSPPIAMTTPLLTGFLLYLAAVLLLGVMAFRMTRSVSDYLLGGRRLGAGTAALSAGASDMSGWLLLGLPGAVYVGGLSQLWIAVGLAVGAWLNWQLVAGRLRTATWQADDALTLPAFFAWRFKESSRLLRAVSAVVILVFFTVYTAAGLVAAAKLFESSFGLDYQLALFAGALIVLAYTAFGGFLAVSWTDVLQATLMLAALVAVPLATMVTLGGWQETAGRVSSLSPNRLDVSADVDWLTAVSLAAWGLGYFGQPHILARFMAIRRASAVPLARLVAMSWMVVGLYGAVFTGLAASAYFGGAGLDDPETAFLRLIDAMFNPWVAGLLLAAVMAAIMSTVDSQLLVSSSALADDLYGGFLRPQAGDRERLWMSRLAVVLIAGVAIWLAANPGNRVLDLVGYAWAGFGAAFGPVVLLALYWPAMSARAALAGMLAGTTTVLVWGRLEGGIFDLYELLPAVIVATASIWAAHWLGR